MNNKNQYYSKSGKNQKGGSQKSSYSQETEKGTYEGRQIGVRHNEPRKQYVQKEEGTEKQIEPQNNDHDHTEGKKNTKNFQPEEAKQETYTPKQRGAQDPIPIDSDILKQILDLPKSSDASNETSKFNSSKTDPFAASFDTTSNKIQSGASTAESGSVLISNINMFEGYDEDVPSDHWKAENPEGKGPAQAQKKKKSRRGEYLKHFRTEAHIDTYNKVRDFWQHLMDTTDEDEDKAYSIMKRTGAYLDNRYSMLSIQVSLFLVLVEDDMLDLAEDLKYNNPKITEVPAAREAAKVLGGSQRNFYRRNSLNQSIKYLRLETFRLAESDIYLIERFDYQTKEGGFTMTAFTRIKDEDFISLTGQVNPFQNEYLSVLQIATPSSIFVFDLIKLCQTKEKATALVENLVSLFQSSKVCLITYHGTELLMNLVKSLFIEKEYQQKDYVAKKTELCRLLEENDHRILNVADYMPGKRLDEIIAEVCGNKLNRESEYADWVNRPLKQDMIEYAALKAYALLMTFKTIVANIDMSA